MKVPNHKLILSVLVVFANIWSIRAQSFPDGNRYAVTLIPETPDIISSSWTKDTFIFESGKMHCTIMKRREGFKAASYNPTSNNADETQGTKFIYESANRYGSTLKIEGTAQSNSVEGTATWTDDNGEHTYTFSGKLL